jgi:anti-sigma-K factor RskA
MSDAEDDKDVLAAEYVLGTLDADDRANAQMLIAIDPAFAANVARWERRLGELHALVEPVEPPSQNWDWIKARIASVPQAGKVWMPSVAEAAAKAAPTAPAEPLPWVAPKPAATPAAAPGPQQASVAPAGAEVVQLSSRLRRFQRLTVAASALAATIAGVAVLREANPVLLPEALRPKPQIVEKVVEVVRTVEVPGQRIAEFVAVFQQDDNLPAPAFLLTVDVERKTVSLRRVGAQQQPDRSFELWIVTPQQQRPRSLGLLAEEGFTVRRALADYDAPTLHNATFGISVEPQGGSPTGQPTGPVVHGRLIQTTPAAFPQTP